jgi:hypothetical protein
MVIVKIYRFLPGQMDFEVGISIKELRGNLFYFANIHWDANMSVIVTTSMVPFGSSKCVER